MNDNDNKNIHSIIIYIVLTPKGVCNILVSIISGLSLRLTPLPCNINDITYTEGLKQKLPEFLHIALLLIIQLSYGHGHGM